MSFCSLDWEIMGISCCIVCILSFWVVGFVVSDFVKIADFCSVLTLFHRGVPLFWGWEIKGFFVSSSFSFFEFANLLVFCVNVVLWWSISMEGFVVFPLFLSVIPYLLLLLYIHLSFCHLMENLLLYNWLSAMHIRCLLLCLVLVYVSVKSKCIWWDEVDTFSVVFTFFSFVWEVEWSFQQKRKGPWLNFRHNLGTNGHELPRICLEELIMMSRIFGVAGRRDWLRFYETQCHSLVNHKRISAKKPLISLKLHQ